MAHMQYPKYKLSFTAASLAISESTKIAEIYLRRKSWDQAKQTIKEDNVLQSRTNSRTTRVARELVQRLTCLTDGQLELLVEGNLPEKKYLLWLATCKTYRFVREFAIEVLHERYLSRARHLTDLDYDAFFKRKADWNDELEQITTSTRKKLKQVLFRMMREADLLTEDGIIVPAIFPSRLNDALKPDAPMSFQIFPIQPADPEG